MTSLSNIERELDWRGPGFQRFAPSQSGLPPSLALARSKVSTGVGNLLRDLHQ